MKQCDAGAERNVRDNETMELAPPSTPRDSLRSYGSATSLNSGSSGNKEAPDTPQQLQVLKHQKEVWETGIDMWVNHSEILLEWGGTSEVQTFLQSFFNDF